MQHYQMSGLAIKWSRDEEKGKSSSSWITGIVPRREGTCAGLKKR